MRLLQKNIGIGELAEVYLWSACATAMEAIDDSSAPQARASFESAPSTAAFESVAGGAPRSVSCPPLLGAISLAREGIVS